MVRFEERVVSLTIRMVSLTTPQGERDKEPVPPRVHPRMLMEGERGVVVTDTTKIIIDTTLFNKETTPNVTVRTCSRNFYNDC